MKSAKNIFSATTALILFAGMFNFVAPYQEHEVKAIFFNQEAREEIDLFWVDPKLEEGDPDRLRFEATIPPRGGVHNVYTFEWHEFAYKYYGQWHYIKISEPNQNHEQLIVLAGHSEMPWGEPRGYRVRCELSIESNTYMDFIDILVMPYWAPRGAVRFLELVRQGYYDDVALNRVVPNFLTQFGIGRNYELRTEVRDTMIWDDFNKHIPFNPGYVSFAGSGPDSRTGEIFIAMPGASEAQLKKFGENPWETPFGFVEGDVENGPLTKIYSGYGDMPPWGTGPDSIKIYPEDGYENYLAKDYPLLDYMRRCFVLEENSIPPDEL